MNIKIVSLLVAVALLTVASPAQTVTTIATLTADNWAPSMLVQGRDGILYGTSFLGGRRQVGSAFKVDPATGTVTQIHSFTGDDGNGPNGLTLATDGYLYGATNFTGRSSAGLGEIYKMEPSGKVTVLHAFGFSDGGYPYAPPIQAADGNFYGTTDIGGMSTNISCSGQGCGVVYRVSSSGQFSVIYNFDWTSGSAPRTEPLQASDGSLNISAYVGGDFVAGTVVQLTTSGALQKSYTFQGTPDPQTPDGTLIQGADGTFYGTSFDGGTSGFYGTVFQLSKKYALRVIHSFALADGTNPTSGVIQGTDGYLYGTTSEQGTLGIGTLYQLSTSGNFVLLDSSLSYPSGLVQHTNGKFYGATVAGGNGYGTIFQLDMGLGPFAALVNPIGKAGQGIGILGQGFTGTSSVTFNGVSASAFNVVSDTYINAIAPTGVTTGPVQVSTPTGVLSSNKNFAVKSH